MIASRRVRNALTAVAVLTLAACSAIPTQGSVQKGDARVQEGDPVVVVAEGPAQNAAPVSVVEGFLLAGSAGLSGDFVDFVAAREFLTPDARSSWDPLGSVVVASSTQVQRTSDTQVTVEVQVAGKVDADGRYTEASADGRESVTFDMVQDSRQQWRIGGAPKGLILSQAAFTSRFRAAELYFLSPDAQVLVPETRWYPSRNLPTSVVKGLLAGPSPWLRDAVRTEVPGGVQLKPEAVTVDSDGVAEVDLEPARTVQSADRGLLLAQLQQSLQLPQVRSVVVRAGAAGVPLDGATSLPTPSVGDPVMIQGDTLVGLVNGGVQPIAGVGSLAGLDARSPARRADGSVPVRLAGPDRLSWLRRRRPVLGRWSPARRWLRPRWTAAAGSGPPAGATCSASPRPVRRSRWLRRGWSVDRSAHSRSRATGPGWPWCRTAPTGWRSTSPGWSGTPRAHRSS